MLLDLPAGLVGPLGCLIRLAPDVVVTYDVCATDHCWISTSGQVFIIISLISHFKS